MDTAVIIAGISALVALSSAWLTYRASKRATDVNHQANAIKWAEEFREDAVAARKEMAEARKDAERIRRQHMMLRQDFETMVIWAHYTVSLIQSPHITIDDLRTRIKRTPPIMTMPFNGAKLSEETTD